MPRIPTPAGDRFWNKVDKNGPVSTHRPDLGPCWLWTAADNGVGYGQLRKSTGVNVYAHRLSYEMAHGPIDEGAEVDHLCRVTDCVNPAHLEAVTPLENTHRSRASEANRARHAARTHCVNGHEFTPENTGYKNDRGPTRSRVCRACGRARAGGRDPRLEKVGTDRRYRSGVPA